MERSHRQGAPGRRSRTDSRVRRQSTPGFGGDKGFGESLLAERGQVMADLQNFTVRQRTGGRQPFGAAGCYRAWTPRARAASSGTWAVSSTGADDQGSANPPGRTRTRLPVAYPQGAAARGPIGIFDRSTTRTCSRCACTIWCPSREWSGRYELINAFESRTRRRGHHRDQMRARRVQGRAEGAAGRTARTPRQVPEIQSGRHRRARVRDDYLEAYQAIFDKTDKDSAPWHLIPPTRSGSPGSRSANS